MKIDNGRSKIYGAGISRHCSSVRFSGIRTERGGKEERGETKLMQRDCEGIYIYIYTSRGSRICRGFARLLKIFPVRRVQKKFPRAGKLPRTGKEDATNFCLRRRGHIRPEWIIMPEHRRKRIPPILNSLDMVGRSIDYPVWLLCVKSTCSRDIFILCARDFFLFLN